MLGHIFTPISKMNDSNKEDIWSEYKRTVIKIFCDKVPIVNHQDKVKTHTKYNNSKKNPNKLRSLKQEIEKKIPESKTDQMFFLYTLHNNKYKISSEKIKKKSILNCKTKLDLHGCTLDDLHHRLKNFCMQCVYIGAREALIITGKGEGIIRKATEDWLRKNPSIIIKYKAIHDSRKEVGCFYISIRLKLQTG